MLISIGGQTDSAKDAVKRTEARQLASLAAFYASTNGGSYEGVCASNTFIKGDGKKIVASIADISANYFNKTWKRVNSYAVFIDARIPFYGYEAVCFDITARSITKDGFAIYILSPNTGEIDCVDSDGNVVIGTSGNRLKRLDVEIHSRKYGFELVDPRNSAKADGSTITCK